jgi:hypothetical protein
MTGQTGFRVFVLGAGFSKLAGLPLGNELFGEVCKKIVTQYGKDTRFQRDLEEYVEYRNNCGDKNIQLENVNLEDFLTFLDMEHYLDLRGKDTWSSEGNESQLLIRESICRVIYQNTPSADKIPSVYFKFAQQLTFGDIVLSFNYDNLLENVLEKVGKPYRLFLQSNKQIDHEKEEVILLKMHGSIDWISDHRFLEISNIYKKNGYVGHEISPVFDHPERFGITPLFDGLTDEGAFQRRLFRIGKTGLFYSYPDLPETPFILSPSYVKFLYSQPLLGFWSGLGLAGALNLGVTVIGFALPEHDEYLRIALYKLITNYQQSNWNESILGKLKNNVKFVDFKNTNQEQHDYKKRYSFADSEKTDFFFEGFGENSLDFIFSDTRN